MAKKKAKKKARKPLPMEVRTYLPLAEQRALNKKFGHIIRAAKKRCPNCK